MWYVNSYLAIHGGRSISTSTEREFFTCIRSLAAPHSPVNDCIWCSYTPYNRSLMINVSCRNSIVSAKNPCTSSPKLISISFCVIPFPLVLETSWTKHCELTKVKSDTHVIKWPNISAVGAPTQSSVSLSRTLKQL